MEIALIFILSLAIPILFLHGAFESPSPSSYQLIICGLKDAYKVGEKIDFQVTLRGTSCGYYPTVAIVYKGDLLQNGQTESNRNSSSIKAGTVVWMFNSTKVNVAMLCPATSSIPSLFFNFGHNDNSNNQSVGASSTYRPEMGIWDMHWIKKPPIIMNQTGNYALEASFDDSKAEKEFTVEK